MSDIVIGADGLGRCPWALGAPEYITYHDDEWGRPVHGDRAIFERLALEAFQSGLSWLIILRKRVNFRAAFHNFDLPAVAAMTKEDVQRLLADPGIVRNRQKIEATISNARACLALDRPLDELVWSYAPEGRRQPRLLAEVAANTPESTALSKELKRRGFRFVGPTTAYAAMQAMGLVNDHLIDCDAGVH